jgi:hypothetical protein
MDGAVVQDLVVDFVAEYQQLVAAGEVKDAVQQVPGVDGPGGLFGLMITTTRVRLVIFAARSCNVYAEEGTRYA